MARLLLFALLGCDPLVGAVEHGGTVYDCGGGVEYCYTDDSAAELSAATGLACHESGVSDRWWPGLTNALGLGCNYCCGPDCGRGANAHNGSWCE